jgi:hypothetical protein
MTRCRFALLAALGLLTGCGDRRPPDGPPVAVAYEAVCDAQYHERLVTVEGFLNLFPRMLYCASDLQGREPQRCQIELLPARTTPHETEEERDRLLLLFIDEGERANRLSAAGYGFGGPARALSADSIAVDPGDRVRVTGRLGVYEDPLGTDPTPDCSLSEVSRIEVVQRSPLTWADSMAAGRRVLQARVDSMREAREARERAVAP